MAEQNTGPLLLPILGDQLTRDLASLRGRTKDDTVILMMEVWDEATYVKHHKQKIVLIFSAMRHFAAELRDAGWTVDYVELTDPDNAGSFTGEVARAIERHDPRTVYIVEAGEWRVQQQIEEWPDKFDCEVEILPDDRFVSSIAEFREWAEDRDTLRMEFFYREMRRKTGLLMDGDKPEGGEWNYDAENRKPPKEGLEAPQRPLFEPDEITQECIDLVAERFPDHFGSLDSFRWPVTRDQAQKAADAFFAERLECFGPYQDAMVAGEDDLFHSMLSTSINLGLLDPLELDFEFDRPVRFVDMEGSHSIVTEPATVRAEYQSQLKRFLDKLRDDCHEFNADYRRVTLDQSYGQVLADFLTERARHATRA